MILSVITLIWLLNSALSVKIPVTIEEVTSPAVKFNQYILSIIVHPTDPRLLIVIDKYAIWAFNPDTKTKTLIAGSTTSGYVEGFGENARFGEIFGSANFNKTTIIITSYMNHCMRLVNTETRMTERYAGVCQSAGFKDGDGLSAQFNYPNGISRIGSDFYVCDIKNKKIRKISQNVVSTITSVSYYLRGLSLNNDKLIYTFLHGLGEFDLNSQSNKNLTGGGRSGYTDGSLSSAQFYYPINVITLTENIFAIADSNNRAVRIVDLNKQFVSSVDLSGNPYSVLAYNGSIMVGMYGGSILKFNMSELPVASVKCPDNIRHVLPEGTSSLSVNVAQPDISRTRFECLSCLPATQQLSVGNHYITFTYKDKLTKENVSCSYTIEVINCQIDVEVNCPDDVKMILPPGVNELNITLPRPQVDELRLKCFHNCLDSVQSLSEGVHNITYKYMDISCNGTTSCSYLINVAKQSKPIQETDVKLEYLSLLSLLIIMAVIPVIILLCKKRQTMETRAEEGDRISMNMINMDPQVNRNPEYDEDGIGSVHEYEVMPDEQEQSPNNRQSMQSDDGYAETYVDRRLCSQPVVQETGLTNDGYEVPDSHRPVPPHV